MSTTALSNGNGTFSTTKNSQSVQFALAVVTGEKVTFQHFDVYPTRAEAESEAERRKQWCEENGVVWDRTLVEVATVATATITVTPVTVADATSGAA